MSIAGSIHTWRDHVRDVIVQNGVPSIAVAVAQDGEMVWEEGFGWANRADRLEATAWPFTAFRAGSIGCNPTVRRYGVGPAFGEPILLLAQENGRREGRPSLAGEAGSAAKYLWTAQNKMAARARPQSGAVDTAGALHG